MEFYQDMINEDIEAEGYVDQYIEPRGLTEAEKRSFEPKRSRIQVDFSKETRNRLLDASGLGPKETVLRALADKYPLLADEILREIKRPSHPTYKYYRLKGGDK